MSYNNKNKVIVILICADKLKLKTNTLMHQQNNDFYTQMNLHIHICVNIDATS